MSKLLATRGVAIVTLDKNKELYELINLQGPRGREPMQTALTMTAKEILARPQLQQFVQVTVKLEHINAQLAVNSLRPFLYSNSGNS